MTYLDDITLPLARVLETAAFHKGMHLAGYSGNLDFWVEEIRHCFDSLAGYERRFKRLVEARNAFASEHRIEVDPSWIAPTLADDEVRKLQDRLRSAAKSFLKRCCEAGDIDHGEKKRIEEYLGIKISFPEKLD